MSHKPRPGSAGAPVKIDYEFPNWCGRAPSGTHLDVMKGERPKKTIYVLTMVNRG
jgi:hypothetical protein